MNIFNKYSKYLLPAIVFSLAFSLQYSVAFLGLDLHHDLIMFDAARNFYSGQIPYRDFFYQYNLGSLILHGATLSALGMKIISLKEITVVFYALMALTIYWSCAIEGAKYSGFVMSVLWLLLSPFYMPAMNGYHAWPTVYMIFACMMGVLFMQLAIRTHPLFFGIMAGIFLCLAFWFKQVAVFQIFAVVFWLAFNILNSWKSKFEQEKFIKISIGYVVGGLLTASPFFVYLYSNLAIYDWWVDAFEFNRHFSVDSQTHQGLSAFFRILFPISKDLGYRSLIWALCPLTLCVISFNFFKKKNVLHPQKDIQNGSIGLLAIFGFAGWVEYFPLPHSFHTQLFMAPTFALIGIVLSNSPFQRVKKTRHNVIFWVISVFIAFAGYEAVRHIIGWSKKQSEYRKDAVLMNLNSSFDGLHVNTAAAKQLVNFYTRFLDFSHKGNGGHEFLPLSVDPLRGFLPSGSSHPSQYKMGVNWTWPNQLIEPNFFQKINTQIKLRQQPIYADSIIYIPGYKPVAILEMRAPISSIHSLYEPQKEASSLIFWEKRNRDILFVSDNDFEIHSRSQNFEWNALMKYRNLIPFDGLGVSDMVNVKNIHISYVEEDQFPKHLSPLQIEYLKTVENYYGENLLKLFVLNNRGGGELRNDLKLTEKQRIAYFMLSSGKLFANQNMPSYSSSFSKTYEDRPVIAGIIEGKESLISLWSSEANCNKMNLSKKYGGKPVQVYLQVKPFLKRDGTKFIIAQVEFKNKKMKNYFYSFLDDYK